MPDSQAAADEALKLMLAGLEARPKLKNRRLLILTLWPERGAWILLRFLRANLGQADVLNPYFLESGWPSWLSRLSLKLAPYYLPFVALFMGRKYDFVAGWSMVFAAAGFIWPLAALFGRVPRLLLRDFHINPGKMGESAYALKLWLLRQAVKGADMLICTSCTEEKIYSQLFGIPLKRVRCLHLGPPSQYLPLPEALPGDYVFSYGNSDRDYPTLIKAVEGLGVKLRILTQAYRFDSAALPANVEIISLRLPGDEVTKLMREALLVVVPTVSFDIAAGQSVMLEAMGLGKPVLVARNVATCEYSLNRDDIIYYECGDAEDLNSKLRQAISDKDELRRRGLRVKEASKLILVNVGREALDILESALD